jgi:hypothetical protein
MRALAPVSRDQAPSSLSGARPPDLHALALQAFANIRTETPFHLAHLVQDESEPATPRDLHPIFHGSYDWHSCVHMHWTLARTLRLTPDAALAADIDRHFARRFTAEAVAGEVAYIRARPAFERPYGWGWLLKLAAELAHTGAEPARSTRSTTGAAAALLALDPLVQLTVERLLSYLPRLDYPVRAGTHNNTAFASLLALDYADAVQHPTLRSLIAGRARAWFGGDRRYPVGYEPSGEDFLAPGLVQAALMRRVLDACDFGDWWQQFAPTDMSGWLTPVAISDASDARVVHLHGLNLSRAWCWRQLEARLSAPFHAPVGAAIAAHLAASLPAATAGEYVGTHWLASFALLALTEPGNNMRGVSGPETNARDRQ